MVAMVVVAFVFNSSQASLSTFDVSQINSFQRLDT